MVMRHEEIVWHLGQHFHLNTTPYRHGAIMFLRENGVTLFALLCIGCYFAMIIAQRLAGSTLKANLEDPWVEKQTSKGSILTVEPIKEVIRSPKIDFKFH